VFVYFSGVFHESKVLNTKALPLCVVACQCQAETDIALPTLTRPPTLFRMSGPGGDSLNSAILSVSATVRFRSLPGRPDFAVRLVSESARLRFGSASPHVDDLTSNEGRQSTLHAVSIHPADGRTDSCHTR
jgi:hypothetical protein